MIRIFEKLWSTRQGFPDTCWQVGNEVPGCLRIDTDWIVCVCVSPYLQWTGVGKGATKRRWSYYTTEADEFQNSILSADALRKMQKSSPWRFAICHGFVVSFENKLVSNIVLAKNHKYFFRWSTKKKEFSDSDAVMFGCNYRMRTTHLWLSI